MKMNLLMQLAHRAESLHSRQDDTSSVGGFVFPDNSTSAAQNELFFAAVEPVRRSIVVLSAFNAIAGLITAAGIYWDCYKRTQRKDPEYRLR